MAERLGEAVLYLSTNATALTRGLNRARLQVGRGVAAMQQRMSVLGAGMGGLMMPLSIAAREGVAELQSMEAANRQTASTIARVGKSTGVTSKQVGAYARQLHKLTGMDDQAIQSGENLLLTLGNIDNQTGQGRKNFGRATQAMVDMAAAMGTEPVAAAKMMGKALADPTKGLTLLGRTGVVFTKQQKDQIKAMQESGDMAGAQGMLIEQLGKKFSGAGAAMGKTTEAKLNRTKEAFAGASASLLTAMLPTLEKLMGHIEKVFTWFETLSPSVKKFVSIGLAVAVAMGPVASILAGVGAAFGVISTVVGVLLSGWGALAAAVAVVVVVWARSEKGSAALRAGLEKLQKIGSKVMAWFTSTGWPAMQKGAEKATTWINDTLLPVVEAVFKDLAKTLKQWGQWAAKFWKAHGDKILSSIKATWAFIAPMVKTALKMVANIIRAVLAVMRGDWGTAWSAIKSAVVGSMKLVIKYLQGSMAIIKAVLGAALGVLKSLTLAAWNWMKSNWLAGMNVIKARFAGWVGWIKNQHVVMWNGIKAATSAAMNWLKSNWMAGWNVIKASISSVWAAITGVITSSWGRIVAVVKAQIRLISAAVAVMGRGVRAAFTAAFRGLSVIVSGALAAAAGVLRRAAGVASAATAAGRSAVTGLANGLAGVANKARDAVASFVATVGSKIKTVTAAGRSIGTAIVDGIVAGVRAAGRKLQDAVNAITSKIPKAIRKKMGIKSPSQVMARQVGMPISEGIAAGMMAGSRRIDKAAKSIARRTRKTFESEFERGGRGPKEPKGGQNQQSMLSIWTEQQKMKKPPPPPVVDLMAPVTKLQSIMEYQRAQWAVNMARAGGPTAGALEALSKIAASESAQLQKFLATTKGLTIDQKTELLQRIAELTNQQREYADQIKELAGGGMGGDTISGGAVPAGEMVTSFSYGDALLGGGRFGGTSRPVVGNMNVTVTDATVDVPRFVRRLDWHSRLVGAY